jgi:hypothetical protein
MPSKNKKVLIKPKDTFDKGLREEKPDAMDKDKDLSDNTMRHPIKNTGNFGNNLS